MPSVGGAAPWLDLAIAELGTKEAPGPANNPTVIAYYRDAGHPEVQSDDVAWCAAFTGAMLARAGLPLPPRDISLLARSYLTYGVACEPQPGAIGVWPRGAAWQGHVAIMVDVDRGAGTCRVVGGNQGDAVNMAVMQLDTALAFRWPVPATVAALRRAGSTEVRTADKIEAAGVVGTVAAVGTATAVEAVRAPEAITGPPSVITGPPSVITSSPPAPIDPDSLKMLDQVIAATKAVGGLVAAHPWLGGCVLGCLALLWLGRRLKMRRVAKAKAGVPLSVEVGP
jgi:uncharacterized protein (TIGR02594 family)